MYSRVSLHNGAPTADIGSTPTIPFPEVQLEEQWRNNYRNTLRHYVTGQRIAQRIMGDSPDTTLRLHTPSSNLLHALKDATTDPEPAFNLFNEAFDTTPGLQEWMIDEFSRGNDAVRHIAAGRVFIDRISQDAEQIRRRSPEQRSPTDGRKALENYSRLEQALFERSGFTDEEQADVVNAWSAWRTGHHKTAADLDDSFAYERNNFIALGSLYGAGSESATHLHREFGIRNFGRYYDFDSDSTILDGQLLTNGNVVLSAVIDRNGGLDGPEWDAEQIDMQEPTYLEARTSLEALQLLVRHGCSNDTPLIQRLLVRAHSTKTSVGDLSIQDIDNFDSRKLGDLKRRLFTPDAEIVLASCDTGQRRGIARKIFRTTGIPTAGSTQLIYGVSRDSHGRYVYEDEHGNHTTGRRYGGRHAAR